MFLSFRSRFSLGILFALFVVSLYYSSSFLSTSLAIESSKDDHPIQILTEQAAEKWNGMLARQSGTLTEAVREYQKRYKRKPPKGFDVWYKWATERGLKLVDEFDTINRDLEPFWGLSPSQIEDRRQEMHRLGNSDRLLTLTIRNGQVGDEVGPASTDKWPANERYWKLFKDISSYLPDMNILINIHDGPVSFVRFEERQRLIEAGRNQIYASDEDEILIDDEITKPFSSQDLALACEPSSPARQTVRSPLNKTSYPPAVLDASKRAFELPAEQGAFVFNQRKQSDLCFNPGLEREHSAFLKPAVDLEIVRGRLYPVFSWSRYMASSDISIPTTYGFNFRDEPSSSEKWNDLIPKVAWRGTCNGMVITADHDVLSSQRWRLMSLLASPFHWLTLYTSPDSPPSEITVQDAQGWLDVGCTSNDLWAQTPELLHKFKTWFEFSGVMSAQQRESYKLLLDIDGWGWSSRLRDLLFAPGAVVKTTVFHEVLSDWLVPWYHYIPVNYAYADLASVLYYYLGLPDQGTSGHDDELQKIAKQGQEWVLEHGMWDHHVAYMFRLALEWARIIAEDRSSMDFVL